MNETGAQNMCKELLQKIRVKKGHHTGRLGVIVDQYPTGHLFANLAPLNSKTTSSKEILTQSIVGVLLEPGEFDHATV